MKDRAPLDAAQRELLRHIADNADYLLTTNRGGLEGKIHWLLLPLNTSALDQLAQFEEDEGERGGSDVDEREPEDGDDCTLPEMVDQAERVTAVVAACAPHMVHSGVACDDYERGGEDDEPNNVRPDSWARLK